MLIQGCLYNVTFKSPCAFRANWKDNSLKTKQLAPGDPASRTASKLGFSQKIVSRTVSKCLALNNAFSVIPYTSPSHRAWTARESSQISQDVTNISFLGLSPQMLLPQTAGSKFKNITPSFLIGVVSDFRSFSGSWVFVVVQEDWLQVAICQGQGRKKKSGTSFSVSPPPHPSFPPI